MVTLLVVTLFAETWRKASAGYVEKTPKYHNRHESYTKAPSSVLISFVEWRGVDSKGLVGMKSSFQNVCFLHVYVYPTIPPAQKNAATANRYQYGATRPMLQPITVEEASSMICTQGFRSILSICDDILVHICMINRLRLVKFIISSVINTTNDWATWHILRTWSLELCCCFYQSYS